MLYLYELCVWIICVDGRSMHLYIVLGGYLRILAEPGIPCCCTLSISTSYRVFVYDRYRKSSLCVVVGPGFVSTSPAFMGSSASPTAGPHGRLGAGAFDTAV